MTQEAKETEQNWQLALPSHWETPETGPHAYAPGEVWVMGYLREEGEDVIAAVYRVASVEEKTVHIEVLAASGLEKLEEVTVFQRGTLSDCRSLRLQTAQGEWMSETMAALNLDLKVGDGEREWLVREDLTTQEKILYVAGEVVDLAARLAQGDNDVNVGAMLVAGSRTAGMSETSLGDSAKIFIEQFQIARGHQAELRREAMKRYAEESEVARAVVRASQVAAGEREPPDPSELN